MLYINEKQHLLSYKIFILFFFNNCTCLKYWKQKTILNYVFDLWVSNNFKINVVSFKNVAC